MNTNRTGKNLDSRCKAKTKKGKAAEKESKLRLTKVEKPLPTQSREGGPTNYGAAHESGKESEPRPTKIEERLPAESREAGPITNNTAAPGLEKESEQRVAKEEQPVPSESREAEPMDPLAMRDLLQQALREAQKS